MTELLEQAADDPISFLNAEVQLCPFSAYDQLRETEPVYVDPKTGHYVLKRYEDIRRVALNPKQFSNKTGLVQTRDTPTTPIANQIFEEHGWLPLDTLISNDPPSHKRYRTLVDKAFSPAKIVNLEPHIGDICDTLIDSFIDLEEIDFLDQFAVKLPMILIADQLGVAAEDMDLFKYWSDNSVESTSPVLAPEREIATTEAIIEFQNYMAKRADYFRLHPDDSKLLSRLTHADVDGRRLNNRELVSILQQLLVAGNETTTAALASGMKQLIADPGIVAQLRHEPERMKTFVEEILRIWAPVQALFRRVLAETEIAGVAIPEGAMLELRWGAGNLDPAVYQQPACPDLGRRNANSHLSFGSGIHLCIGNQLARGEMRVAFSRLIARLDNFRATRGLDSYAYTPLFISYGLTRLWMAFDRRS